MPDTCVLDQLRQASPLVSVGILTADLMSLGSELRLMESAGVKLLHIDVMDGCFCPMMTVGPPFIKAMKTPLLKDVHLMVQDPLEKIGGFIAAGSDLITVHVESCRNAHRVLQVLGGMTNVNDAGRGILRGIALSPGTPVETIVPLMDEIEAVFLLAVNPGWKGQKFIPSIKAKLAQVMRMVHGVRKDILVGVDGGITRDNVKDVARTGADIIVTGSAVFDGKAPLENARFMINAVNEATKASEGCDAADVSRERRP